MGLVCLVQLLVTALLLATSRAIPSLAPRDSLKQTISNALHHAKQDVGQIKDQVDGALQNASHYLGSKVDLYFNESKESIQSWARQWDDVDSNAYAPRPVPCPSTPPRIREATQLSPQETAWVQQRRAQTIAPLTALLTRINIPDFPTAAYLASLAHTSSAFPTIGIAASGGGYRAMLTGAGAIKAFDQRTTDHASALGGLLQSATYIAGLSGGSWLLGSIFINNFTDISSLQQSATLWDLTHSLLDGPKQTDPFLYWVDLIHSANKKRDADPSFHISFTDIWARGLSWQLINATQGGLGITWSSLTQQEWFTEASAPLPLIVIDARDEGQTATAGVSTVFEVTPWELGSFDHSLAGFAPLAYLGSKFSGGEVSSQSCWQGFDNAGFIMGTSSSLFNSFAAKLSTLRLPAIVQKPAMAFLQSILTDLGEAHDDVAIYSPNPFRDWKPATNQHLNAEMLTLVDGGEDGQNLPLLPLLHEQRQVDVIFAIDSSSNTNGYPNGSTLSYTQARARGPNGDMVHFPVVPEPSAIVERGLNTHPNFFGCYESGPIPLVVWLPNANYSYPSNIGTFTLHMSTEERDGMIQNGYDAVTQESGQRDSSWPVCVGCAILLRSFNETQTPVPAACQSCFEQYCWTDTIAA
ncbi:MAG: Lysophospholipase 1 [Thelocarpon superellum]|nr:MAG: Lysophospholipase 1 [Thelocarpon superellum]